MNFVTLFLRTIPIDINNLLYWLRVIDEQHLLVGYRDKAVLFQIDYHSWTVSFISKYDIEFQKDNILIDEMNNHNFLIHYRAHFVISNVINNGIIFSPR